MITKHRLEKVALDILESNGNAIKDELEKPDAPGTELWMGGKHEMISTKGEPTIYSYTLIALSPNMTKVKGLSDVLGPIGEIW